MIRHYSYIYAHLTVGSTVRQSIARHRVQLEMIVASRAPLGKEEKSQTRQKEKTVLHSTKRKEKSQQDPEKKKMRQGAGTILELCLDTG